MSLTDTILTGVLPTVVAVHASKEIVDTVSGGKTKAKRRAKVKSKKKNTNKSTPPKSKYVIRTVKEKEKPKKPKVPRMKAVRHTGGLEFNKRGRGHIKL